MANSTFWHRNKAPDGMALGLHLVTPSDSADLEDEQGYGLSTVDGGDIKFEDAAGNTHTITFPAGGGVECGIKRVYATGTTATEIYVGVIA